MSVDKRIGAGEGQFDALSKRQFVTESIYNNSLADRHTWSTIKTLPATLPEPSSMDRGSRTGVTGGLPLLGLDLRIKFMQSNVTRLYK